jgi:hypothetical protein
MPRKKKKVPSSLVSRRLGENLYEQYINNEQHPYNYPFICVDSGFYGKDTNIGAYKCYKGNRPTNNVRIYAKTRYSIAIYKRKVFGSTLSITGLTKEKFIAAVERVYFKAIEFQKIIVEAERWRKICNRMEGHRIHSLKIAFYDDFIAKFSIHPISSLNELGTVEEYKSYVKWYTEVFYKRHHTSTVETN